MFLKVIRFISRILLRVIARVEMSGFENLPPDGAGCIVTANHIGRLDAMLGFILTDRDDIVMFIAEKYQEQAHWRWFVRKLDGVWLNRHEVDFAALRRVYQRVKQGQLLAMAPEGTRSASETLAPGKPGAAYLAAKAGVPIIPAALTGTEDRVVSHRLRRLRRLDITVRIGRPYYLPPFDRGDRDAYLAQSTEEIMCQIAALLPPRYRGVYADHPRLHALLAQQPAGDGHPAAGDTDPAAVPSL